jgi:hypothetical protein
MASLARNSLDSAVGGRLAAPSADMTIHAHGGTNAPELTPPSELSPG